MDRFSEKAKSELKFYVYCLVDPDNKELFYVGKGQKDRVFAHGMVNNGLTEEDRENNDKEVRIKKIGYDRVERYIVRHGLSENEAELVESVLIDFLNVRIGDSHNLTNIQLGKDSNKYGLSEVALIERKYGYPPLKEANFTDNVLIVKVSRSLKEDTAEARYAAARGDWAMDGKKVAEMDHYVLVDYNGSFIDIFKPLAWEKTEDGRMRFEKDDTCDLAEYREKYCNHRNDLDGNFSQRGFKYVGPWGEKVGKK